MARSISSTPLLLLVALEGRHFSAQRDTILENPFTYNPARAAVALEREAVQHGGDEEFR